ncbi:hypothetical protein M5K25_027846 [Dendrobium thyrsiflorum]|uniref:Aminotransferase-like plant mobile domain-containing protein n=1 Tax=Dendrobium thyrsiflorum TaxID=117978 RepID=A0ABD0TUX0_DENTH
MAIRLRILMLWVVHVEGNKGKAATSIKRRNFVERWKREGRARLKNGLNREKEIDWLETKGSWLMGKREDDHVRVEALSSSYWLRASSGLRLRKSLRRIFRILAEDSHRAVRRIRDDVLDALVKSIHQLEEMFRWQRPDDLPPSEPSEAAIWAAIDRQDLQGSADVQDRLEQHQDMLFFARSPLLPECSEDSVVFEDPESWVTSLRLQCGEYHPLESSVAQVGWGTCDVLEPAADTVESVGQSSLLSHRQLQPRPLEWPRDSMFGEVQSLISEYVYWAQYVLREAGIYEAVYASLFDYGRLPTSWARGLAEFWDASRGTFWVGAEELTVTLSDLQAVSGLPIFGQRFEECVPPDEQLFRRVPSVDGDRRGRLLLPDVYPVALQHYRQTYRALDLSRRVRASMPVSVWVCSLLQEYLSSVTVLPHDSFGFNLQRGIPLSEESAEPSSTGCTSPGLLGVREDLLLVGFLATWLCVFVLPLRVGSLRCSVLLAASQLAQGQRLALAPAVLTRVYRVLRTISEASSLEVRDSALPWQYLYAWVHLHRGYPTVLQLSQTSSTFELERISLCFFAPQLVSDRFSLIHQSDVFSLPPHQRGTVVVDGVDHGGRRTLLLNMQSLAVAEYLISMRPDWLCYRAGASVTLESYQPNRVARQFGFFQATAYDGRPLVPGVVDTRRMDTAPLETRLYAAALSWLHILRLGTGSSFLLAQPSAHTGVSYTRLAWVRQSFGPALEHSARRYERRVRELGLPRGRRSRRGHSETAGGRGTGVEACTVIGTVVPSPARAPEVAAVPSHTECTTSSRRSVDVRPSPRDLVESPQEPRRSDFTGYSTPGPSSDFFFPVDPYGSFWPGESSGGGVVLPSELFGGPSHTQMTLDLVPAEFSFFPGSHSADPAGPSSALTSYPVDSASPSTALEGFDYSSEIPCYVPVPPNLRTTDRCHHLVVLLRDLVSSIDPRSPESWVGFTSSAGRLLGLFADFGVDTTELAFWEAVCREAESCIWQLMSLSVTWVRVMLPQLEQMVASRRMITDDTHDRLDCSAEALRRHRRSSSGMTQEVDGLTARMQELWRDIRQMMSRTHQLQVGRDRRDRLTRREEQRHRSLQQEMMEADTLLVQAVEQFQRAQTEFQILDDVTGRLQSLRDRLY